jgi:hypothetical protein
MTILNKRNLRKLCFKSVGISFLNSVEMYVISFEIEKWIGFIIKQVNNEAKRIFTVQDILNIFLFFGSSQVRPGNQAYP